MSMPIPDGIDISDPRAYLTLYGQLAGATDQGRRGNGHVVIPTEHSFVSDPESALAAAEAIVLHGLSGKPILHLDHSGCNRVDGCADTVTAALTQQLSAAGCVVNRQFPICVGRNPGPDGCGNLDRLYRDKFDLSRALMECSTILKDQLEIPRWRLGKRLSRDLMGFFLGEAIGNALQYGVGDCWFSTVVRKNVGDGALARIEFAVFNLGASIDQTIYQMPHQNRTYLDGLLRHHADAGFFVDGGWTPEALLVRHALQHQITSNTRGGVGTRWILTFFEELAKRSPESAPECVIVTGRTHVRLSTQYRLKRSRLPSRPAPILDIAFNRQNDFLLPGDPACFTTMSRRLPGTLVTLQFTLHPSHLSERKIRHENPA
jgi:hypothetical protein